MIELLPNVIEIKQTRQNSTTSLMTNRSISHDESSRHIDEPAIKLKENEINMLSIVNAQLDAGSFIETQVKLIEKWNRITPCIIEGKRLVIDRRTWIAKNGTKQFTTIIPQIKWDDAKLNKYIKI